VIQPDWICERCKKYHPKKRVDKPSYDCDCTDLPPTDAECLRNEKVRALLREAIISGMRIATLTPIEEVPEAIEAALSALTEVKE
jgi:hypothetical protein